MSKVNEVIAEIRDNRKQQSASYKDEVKVMKEMLNDKGYIVGIYDASGRVGELCPAVEARNLATSIIAGATKISSAEAATLAEDYEFKKADAQVMINITKEFINTYADTGRKIPLGGREFSNISLIQKIEDERLTTYPKKVGIDENGVGIYQPTPTVVRGHKSMRVNAGCPEWIK